MIVGISVHPTSSALLPWTSSPTSFSLCRRNLNAAKIISTVTSTAKNSVVIRMNENNASTLPAKLDAWSGNVGSGDCTALVCSLRRHILVRMLVAVVAAPEYHEAQHHAEQRNHAAHADHGHDRGAVPRLRWVVLVTKQQQVIHRRPDLP